MHFQDLELVQQEKREFADAVLAAREKFDEQNTPRDGFAVSPETKDLVSSLLSPPAEAPSDLEALLDVVFTGANHAANASGSTCFGHIPGSSLESSVWGDFLSRSLNRHAGFTSSAPAFIAMEQSVVRWLCTMFGLPSSAGGIFTTGASQSTITTLAAARINRLGDNFADATIYVNRFTHSCIFKSLRVTGFSSRQIRMIDTDEFGRMDVEALQEQILRDRNGGYRPFMVMATAGYTDTGMVDDLPSLGDLAEKEHIWLHIDAAYGGFFQLTTEGRELLKGIERADSLVLDPHKGLFLPFGTGVLLVREESVLQDAYQTDAAYVRDMAKTDILPNRADMSTELTVEFRGLRIWLPLHLHGVEAFRSSLTEKLELAARAHQRLQVETDLVVRPRGLSTVVFRARSGDEATRLLFDSISSSGVGTLSTTTIDDKLFIRLCVLSNETHQQHVDRVIDYIAYGHRAD